MRELESALQQFGEFLLKGRFVKEAAAPYCVRHVRQFLSRATTNDALVDRVRNFCEDLQRAGSQDWQVRQAEHALRLYFVNFLERADWHHPLPNPVVDPQGQVTPLAALEQLRQRLRARHYSYRTEESYTDWVRRFLGYLAERQGVPRPRVDAAAVRDFPTNLAVGRHVSASTQNQAVSALLFLCRDVLGIHLDGLELSARAKRGTHLPVVLSMPETAALLDTMRGTARLMATLIYGGGLRLSECCELRVKDLDFDQGLVFVRSGKGDKDRSTLLAESGRDELRAHLRQSEILHQADRRGGLAGVWLPDALDRKYPSAGREFGWFWSSPATPSPPIPGAASSAAITCTSPWCRRPSRILPHARRSTSRCRSTRCATASRRTCC